MSGRLQGKIALITGGCSGIGLATVERFVEEGAKVLAVDMQDEKGANLERAHPGAVVYRRCDVTDETQIAAVMEAAKQVFGGLDILVNNAGSSGPATGIIDMDVAGWDATMALLLRGPMLGMKYAAPLMVERGGGSIVNIASIASFEAGWGLAYGVAKAAVLSLSQQSAPDLSKSNIRVNAVCPGVIVTPIFGISVGLDRAAADQTAAALVDGAARMQPIQRAGAPRDIANAVLYFASDEASFVTGTHQLVDGGIRTGQRIAWDDTAALPIHEALFTIAPDPEGGAA